MYSDDLGAGPVTDRDYGYLSRHRMVCSGETSFTSKLKKPLVCLAALDTRPQDAESAGDSHSPFVSL